MTPESENNLRLEIGRVLSIDIIGSSKVSSEKRLARRRDASVTPTRTIHG